MVYQLYHDMVWYGMDEWDMTQYLRWKTDVERRSLGCPSGQEQYRGGGHPKGTVEVRPRGTVVCFGPLGPWRYHENEGLDIWCFHSFPRFSSWRNISGGQKTWTCPVLPKSSRSSWPRITWRRSPDRVRGPKAALAACHVWQEGDISLLCIPPFPFFYSEK